MKYSRLIAGTMSWGIWGKLLPKAEMIAMIHHCINNQITTFDHADIYGAYTTEAEVGKAFADSGIDRDSVQLISKCGIQYVCDKRTNKVKHYNHSKDYIIWSVENSLTNLKTDYLDLLLLHRPSPLMHPDEIAEGITILKQQGKIKDFGVSNFSSSQMALISKNVEISVNQIEFSLTQHQAMQDGTLDHMMLNNIQPMSWSPLGSTFKEVTEQTQRVKKQLDVLKQTYNATDDQLLLAWILKHPSGVHPVLGTTTKERITNAAKALTIDLDLEDWFLMLVASQGHKVP